MRSKLSCKKCYFCLIETCDMVCIAPLPAWAIVDDTSLQDDRHIYNPTIADVCEAYQEIPYGKKI